MIAFGLASVPEVKISSDTAAPGTATRSGVFRTVEQVVEGRADPAQPSQTRACSGMLARAGRDLGR